MRLFDLFEAETFHAVPYFHGTTAEFEGVPYPSKSGVYGPGIYFSRKKDVAASYAQRNGMRDVIVKEYRIRGKLATDRMLSTALAQASSEGFKASAKYPRASEILAAQGYSGIEDGPVTVIFDSANVTPIAS